MFPLKTAIKGEPVDLKLISQTAVSVTFDFFLLCYKLKTHIKFYRKAPNFVFPLKTAIKGEPVDL